MMTFTTALLRFSRFLRFIGKINQQVKASDPGALVTLGSWGKLHLLIYLGSVHIWVQFFDAANVDSILIRMVEIIFYFQASSLRRTRSRTRETTTKMSA